MPGARLSLSGWGVMQIYGGQGVKVRHLSRTFRMMQQETQQKENEQGNIVHGNLFMIDGFEQEVNNLLGIMNEFYRKEKYAKNHLEKEGSVRGSIH